MPAYSRYIALGEETTYGTAVTVNRYFDMTSESLRRRPSLRTVSSERNISALRQYEQRRIVQGGLDLYAGWTGIGRLLKGLIGSPTTTGLGGGYYRHAYTPADKASVVSWTVDIPRDVDTHRYTGTNPNSLRISIGQGDLFFGVALECLGKTEASVGSIASVAASVFELAMPLMSSMTLTLVSGVVTYVANFQSLDIDLKVKRELRQSERSQTPTGIIDGHVWSATARVKWVYDSDTDDFLAVFRSRASTSVTFDIASGSYLLRVTMPTCQLNGDPPTVKGAGVGDLDMTMNFSALLDSSTESPFTVRLENQQASY